MKNKKEEEKIILSMFIEAYKNTIDNNSNFEILEKESAKIHYPDYNGENPDFVVRLNGNFVGIEIFELIRNNLEELNKDISENKLDIKNAAHLYSIREKDSTQYLYLMEDLAIAALDRINDKIQNKVNNYISCPIWLIGYAHKSYNLFLLSSYFEDKIEKEVASYISNHIHENNKIQKVFLVEFSNKYLLLQIK